jgi:hypothetical protein
MLPLEPCAGLPHNRRFHPVSQTSSTLHLHELYLIYPKPECPNPNTSPVFAFPPIAGFKEFPASCYPLPAAIALERPQIPGRG